MHGGKTPRGIALPQTTHGRYSKALPTRLLAVYSQAAQDLDLLSMREEVQVLDSRIEDVMRRVDTGESGRAWAGVRAAFGEFRQAQGRGAGGVADAMAALSDLGRLIDEGVADYAAWADVRALFGERRRLVESERKRMLETQQYVAVEKTLLFVQSLSESIRRNVTDRKILEAIQQDISLLIGTDIRNGASAE